MDDHRPDQRPRERPVLMRGLAVAGVLGCVAMIVGMFAAQAMVPDYYWVSDTISDLGAGELEIVMDIALYGFAGGLVAVSLAAAHAHLGGAAWSAGVLSLAFLAAIVIVVGARNEYGDGDDEGVVIHIYLVYALGLLFAAMPLCLAPGLRRHHGTARHALIALTCLWVVLCPVFLLSPTGIDGLLERGLGLVAIAMVCTLCTVFWRRAQGAAGSGG